MINQGGVIRLEELAEISDTCGTIKEIIYYILSGSGFITVNNIKNKVEKGDTVIIKLGDVHLAESFNETEFMEILVITDKKYDVNDIYEK